MERVRVRAACMQCHEGGDEDCSRPSAPPTAKDCVECHMPLVEVFDVSAVKIHDHKIARAPSAPESYPRIRVKHAKGGDVARFQWPWLEPHKVDPGLEMMAALMRSKYDGPAVFLAGMFVCLLRRIWKANGDDERE